MIKKTFLTFFAALCVLAAQAQRDEPPLFTFGPKAGLNLSTLVGETRNFSSEYRLGYNAGIFLRFNLGKLYIQPEAFFATKGARLNIDQSVDPNVRTGTYRLSLQNVDVPVLVGLTMIQNNAFNIRIFGGPMGSYNLQGRGVGEFVRDLGSVEAAYRRAVLGYQFGAGVDVGSLTIDARYEGSLTPAADWDRVNLGKPRGGLYQVSVGIKIL